MIINASTLDYKTVNSKLRDAGKKVQITGCIGQRFIAAGMNDKQITIDGIPGNALGAYLNGAEIIVNGNAQDAVGDTMNEGRIIIHGNIGDAAGYAMRGGKIFVQGNAGYRAGIHMKAYQEKVPTLVIGGVTGSFLGEYQAGGTIMVLGLHSDRKIVGNFTGTGMHGGKLILRGDVRSYDFPGQVKTHLASAEEKAEIKKLVSEFCTLFGEDEKEIMNSDFTIITPDSANPYKRMYVAN